MLQKLSIISKNVSNKSCAELNFLQKNWWKQIFISSRRGGRGAKHLPFAGIKKYIPFGAEAVFPDDFLKNPYKQYRKNPYRLKKFRTFFRHRYQIKGFCKYYEGGPIST